MKASSWSCEQGWEDPCLCPDTCLSSEVEKRIKVLTPSPWSQERPEQSSTWPAVSQSRLLAALQGLS